MPYQPKTLGELVDKSYNMAIASDGIDIVNETVNGKSYTGEELPSKMLREFVKSKARKTLAFFFGPFIGFRNDSILRNRNGSPKLNPHTGDLQRESLAWTFLKDLLWWPDKEMATGKRIAQIAAMILLTGTLLRPAYVLFRIAYTTLTNVGRLFLEFLPTFAYEGFTELKKRVKDRLNDTNPETKPNWFTGALYELADLGLDVLRGVTYAWKFIGRATLSPIEGARQARKEWGLWGAIFSGVATVLSWAIILSVALPYAFTYAPTVITFVSNTVVPFLTANLPSWLMAGVIEPVASLFGGLAAHTVAFLTSAPVMNFFSMMFMPVLNLAPSFSAALGLTPFTAGVAATATVAATTVGLAIDKAWDAARFAITNGRNTRIFEQAPIVQTEADLAARLPLGVEVPQIATRLRDYRTSGVHDSLLEPTPLLTPFRGELNKLQNSVADVAEREREQLRQAAEGAKRHAVKARAAAPQPSAAAVDPRGAALGVAPQPGDAATAARMGAIPAPQPDPALAAGAAAPALEEEAKAAGMGAGSK